MNDIDTLFKEARNNIQQHIELLVIQANSFDGINKKCNESLIEFYLKRRGYTLNNILKRPVWVKDFTCVYIDDNFIEVWHDRTKNNKSVFITDSLLTGIPITLNYMEKI